MDGMGERLASRLELLLERTPEQMAYMCRRFGRVEGACCPKGVFACPFSSQDESGNWIVSIGCRDVAPEDWRRLLESAGNSQWKKER